MSTLTVELLDGRGYNGVTLFLAIAALISTVVAVYFAREALFPPSRRLVVRVLYPVRLPHRDAGGDSAEDVSGVEGTARADCVEVPRNGEPAPDRHVVTVLLRNTGRHAISTAQFDQNRPITVDIRATIKEVLSPAGPSVQTTVKADGTTLKFGPDLIRQKQEISIQVITWGRPDPEFTVSEHLVDTRVDVERGDVDPHPAVSLEQHLPTAFAAAGTVALITLIIVDVLLGG
jgi:hypothetical protein